MNRQTYLAKNEEVPRHWVHTDATDQVLGRLASKIAVVLMGKNKPQYTPHHDVGDFVIVTNVDKIKITGSKPDQKYYKTYSRYPGGHKQFSFRWMLENKPELLLTNTVRRMLPKNKLARDMLTKLKVYRGSEHPHQAQDPKPLA
jgi:large subunit ribosomal protein L13